jgi:PTH1 family peptidyl-tRNA hydrolase
LSSSPWLVVGLGNPGPEYAATRHNVGFLVTDLIADQVGTRLARHKRGHALAAEGRFGMPGAMSHIVLVEPLSFMNESGGPVKALMGFYGVPADRMVVVHDELDIAFSTIRVKFGGGDNGHNGLKSIRKALGTGDFYRIRVGIGRPPGRQDPADFVLKPFPSAERADLPEVVQRSADAVECLVIEGLEATQNRFNSVPT